MYCGGVNLLVSEYDSRRAQIYTEATTKLAQVQECSHEFQTPVHAIFIKLKGNQRLLTNLKRNTSHATTVDDPEGIRQKSYEFAKKEAQGIMDVCREIREHALAIDLLKGQLTYKFQQITEP